MKLCQVVVTPLVVNVDTVLPLGVEPRLHMGPLRTGGPLPQGPEHHRPPTLHPQQQLLNLKLTRF